MPSCRFHWILTLCIIAPLWAFAAQFESETNKIPDRPGLPATDEIKKAEPVAVPPPLGQLPRGLWRFGDSHFAKFALVVDKSQRTLSVWKGQGEQLQFVEAVPVDIGRALGDKSSVGDLKTPEGLYFVEKTFQGNQIDFNEYGQRAFTLDYPNFFDRLKNKRGNGIWLHGIPDSKSLNRGSRGCVVVRNDVIAKLAPYVQLERTPVLIFDQVHYLEPGDHAKEQKTLLGQFEKWRASWQNKNLDDYMRFYDERFSTNHMGKTQWRGYKQSLNEKYSSITVKAEDPAVFQRGDDIVIQFVQNYTSDLHSDVGEKTLFARKQDDGFSILSEVWRDNSSRLAGQ